MLNIGTIVGGAFGLLRGRFGAVVVWGLLYTLAAFALGYLILAWMAPTMLNVDENADPAVAFGAVSGLLGRMMLLYFGFYCVYMVLLTAAQRAVLRPEESGFAALRFGGDELRAIALGIVIGIIFFVVYLVGAFVLALLFGFGAAAGGAGLGIAVILGIIALCIVLLLLWARLSLAFPLTLLRGRIVLGEAWTLGSGHTWTLFFGYLVLILAVIAITLVGAVLLQGGYWAAMLEGGGMIDPAAQQAQIDAQYSLGPAMLLGLAFGAISGGLMIALTGGAIASAARALDADHEGMARTFS